MGWPPCSYEGCDNWPAVGFTGVCSECIKDPKRVEKVAREMCDTRLAVDKEDREDVWRFRWLTSEPNGEHLKMVLNIIEGQPGVELRKAVDLAHTYYNSIKRNKS